MDGWMVGGCMDGGIEGGMEGWMDGWMDGWILYKESKHGLTWFVLVPLAITGKF